MLLLISSYHHRHHQPNPFISPIRNWKQNLSHPITDPALLLLSPPPDQGLRNLDVRMRLYGLVMQSVDNCMDLGFVSKTKTAKSHLEIVSPSPITTITAGLLALPRRRFRNSGIFSCDSSIKSHSNHNFNTNSP